MISVKRYYIMPEIWVTVTQSQVFNWVKLVNDFGIPTDCVSFTSRRIDPELAKRITNSLGGRFFEIKDRKRLIVNDIILLVNILHFYFKGVFTYDRTIFQTRMPELGFVFFLLRWLPRSSFVFESRAAGLEENQYTKSSIKRNIKTLIKDWYSEKNEQLIIRSSNQVFCVSNALKDYYKRKYELPDEHFKVIPGAADSDIFFYDRDLRNRMRSLLNFNDKDLVLVYSGRLEMKWEIPEKILDFFVNLNKKDERFKLLIVTPDVDIAHTLTESKDCKKIVRIESAELHEVNRFLNAADFGLLLRENVTMNNVASPTKFAEYLLSGIPVIISEGVFDFAKIVSDTSFGVVVSSLDSISENEYRTLLDSLEIPRQNIANWGSQNLSKKAFIQDYVSILQRT